MGLLSCAACFLVRCSDLGGIGFFILVCMINGIVHAFRCSPAWRVVYLVTQSSLGFLTVATPVLFTTSSLPIIMYYL